MIHVCFCFRFRFLRLLDLSWSYGLMLYLCLLPFPFSSFANPSVHVVHGLHERFHLVVGMFRVVGLAEDTERVWA